MILSSSAIFLVSKDELSYFIVDRSFKLWRSHRFNYKHKDEEGNPNSDPTKG